MRFSFQRIRITSVDKMSEILAKIKFNSLDKHKKVIKLHITIAPRTITIAFTNTLITNTNSPQTITISKKIHIISKKMDIILFTRRETGRITDKEEATDKNTEMISTEA
jgi:hypothetical protein